MNSPFFKLWFALQRWIERIVSIPIGLAASAAVLLMTEPTPETSRAQGWVKLVLGVSLVSIGVGLHDTGAGLAVAGVIILLSLEPLLGWLK